MSPFPSMMCEHCRQPLNKFSLFGSADVTYVHARIWEDEDHEPVPVPLMEDHATVVCDFCIAEPADFIYLGKRVTRAAIDYGNRWSGCRKCDQFIKRRDIPGLVNRVLEVTPSPTRTSRADVESKLNEYVPSIYQARRHIPAPTQEPPQKIRPAMLPKVRDRLARFWESDAAAAPLNTMLARGERILVPGVDAGRDEHFQKMIHDSVDVPAMDAVRRRIHLGLCVSDLYYISSEFVYLAVNAGKDLPDLTVTRSELPAAHGLVVFESPIAETRLDGVVHQVPIMAVSWTQMPGGVWLTPYTQVEYAVDMVAARDLSHTLLRETIGWLMPWIPGVALPYGARSGDAKVPESWRTILATWFLINQPGVADVTPHQHDKSTRKKYQRTGKNPPNVHVVSLRRGTARTSSGESGEDRRAVSVRFMVRGHWRNQAYGPERSERRRIYIAPFLKGPDDAPFKASTAEVVKVLR